MHRYLAALALAIVTPSAIHAQEHPAPAQDESAGPVTLGEWANLPRKERQAMILASIESLFLAVAEHPQHAEIMDEQCLSGITPKHVERVMKEVAGERPDLPFVDTFLALTECYGSAVK